VTLVPSEDKWSSRRSSTINWIALEFQNELFSFVGIGSKHLLGTLINAVETKKLPFAMHQGGVIMGIWPETHSS
jgi:hypothetical protein